MPHPLHPKVLVANWKLIAGYAAFLLAIGGAQKEMSDMRDDITAIQKTHPDTMSSQMEQHFTDLKEVKNSLKDVSTDTAYSRGKLDALSTQMEQFDQRLQSLEVKIGRKN